MTRYSCSIIPLTFLLVLSMQILNAQAKADSLTDELKSKLNHFKNLTIGFYVDTYFNLTLDNKKDTSNLIPFSANCPVRDQIRINHGAIELYYKAEKVRGAFAVQWGDAPNLLSATNAQFIKNIDQANFGFLIVKNLWIDFGYQYNPVGYESTWAVKNKLSTATIGGYFEPGKILGIKLSFKFSEKFNGGLMFGNPYSLAYGKNTHLAGTIFLKYQPFKTFSIAYNNFFGNQALKNAEIKNNILYNNIIIIYNPIKQISLAGQLDFAAQTNSQMPPDTNKIATMFSGFIQAGYIINQYFSFYTQYQFFTDPDGFLSGNYTYNGYTTGLSTWGITAGFEYKPVKIGYIRLEYRFLQASDGNKVFYSNQLDHMNVLTFTTGVRF